ncbi:MAG: ceramidase domain-containing protein [Leptonema sp. (in: bacteria)]
MLNRDAIYLKVSKYGSLACLGFFLILVLYLNNHYPPLFYSTENFYKIFGKASCLPHQCFCENIDSNRIAQPINSLTNIFYIYTGIGILFSLQKCNLFSILYAYITIFLGLGSFFYHATMTFFGQWWDVFFMYVYVLFLIFFLIYKSQLANKRILVVIYFVILTISGIFLYLYPNSRRILFGFYVFLTIFAFYITNKKIKILYKKYFFQSLFLFIIAYTIWILDFFKIICNPHSPIQGHGIWHTITSMVILYLYIFFKKNFY